MPDKNLLQAKTLVYISPKQRQLFELLVKCGTLTFVAGPTGIGIHLTGEFHIRSYNEYGPEFRLDLEDGRTHVHIDWSRISRCQIANWEEEGGIAFYDSEELLFKLFRLDGLFPPEVTQFEGELF